MTNDTIAALISIQQNLQYEKTDAWLEHSDGLFEYCGVPGHGLDAAISELDTLITQLEQPETQKQEVDIEAIGKAMWQKSVDEAMAGGKWRGNAPIWEEVTPRVREIWTGYAQFCATAWGMKAKGE